MKANFEMINVLKKEWDALQPLSPENEQRLWKKLRLEWNYHSNHIEGNTLTYGETELLLLHGQTHGNHTLREYEEMKAHDVGIAHLLTLAKDKALLVGESDIRDLNKLILKEPFWKAAQTAEGKPSRKQIIPGDYKTSQTMFLPRLARCSNLHHLTMFLLEWQGSSSGLTPTSVKVRFIQLALLPSFITNSF